MKTLKHFFAVLFFLSVAAPALAQTHTQRYASMASNTRGYYEYLPEGYDAAGTATYPLILFMTGIGEFGDGSPAQLPYVLKNGIPNLIEAGKFPKSFTVNGQTHRFLVITPQFLKNDRPTADDMNTVLDYIVSHYKVNRNRIYITGLSYGGGLSFAYPGAKNAYAQRVAAVVPVASPVPLPRASGFDTIYARSRVIAANNVAVWATHNLRDHDDTVATTIAYINDINQPPAPTPAAKMNLFDAGGHNAWDRTYDPARKEFGGLNVYEWMLQYQRTIVPPNQPPKAAAGMDQTITLPTNSTTLNGSGTDVDGTVTYRWTQVSGPATAGIASPNAAVTGITGLAQGTYVFRLTVTDDKGATATDDVSVTVNKAPNQVPTANAGTDQTITLPVNSVTLSGSGTDSDGSITAYAWTKVSGPVGGTIATTNNKTTTVTGLQQGNYVFRLTVTDNDGATASDDITITVNAAPNKAPVANAGADITITLPTSTATLSGSGTDADGTIASYLWTKVSGPQGGTITTPNAATTTITALQQGTYVFRFTVTDNDGATASDEVTIIVNAVPNQPPTADAGDNQTITLPTSNTTLSGTGTDNDGTIASFAWTKVSGTVGGTITTPNNKTTTVTGLQQGSYIFRLTVTDNDGATASDEVTITVNAAPNQPPAANAGTDQTITLPTHSITVTGAATDNDGKIVSYLWTKVSGPQGGTITTPNAATTTITALQQGTYVFRFTVTDNDGATAADDVTVTVNAAPNQPPTATAGADQTITLPTNQITLAGSGADNDGKISSYAWTKISGSASGTITNPNAATTTVTGLAEGVYAFRLTVTDDDGATATDDVVITVNKAPNKPPVVNAGADQAITLPANKVTITATATDADGSIVQYAWTKTSGPGGAITNPDKQTTDITGLVQGVYVFRITVKDNEGATAFDEVTVTVNAPENKTPAAHAGADVAIILPLNKVTLLGSGTDEDGTITSFLWTKVSGPAGAVITAGNAAATDVTGLVQGTYVFRLTVTDNDGATASDDVTVTVNAAPNVAPQANAGENQTITLPVNSVKLTGDATDSDGNIASYLWTKISGPQGGNLTTPGATATTITALQQGTYVFRFTVTDNDGATASDDVTIIVNAVPNQPPTADAGDNQTITLPTSNTTLSGSGTDNDGTIASFAWIKVSGPAGGTIATTNNKTTTVTGLQQGNYVFRLTVNDNDGATASDDITITVNAAPNKAPVANAGADITITLPTSTATLSGSGLDADGTIASYLWTKLSGPDAGVIATSNAAQTTLNNLVQGTYTFRLTLTDNQGVSDSDDVTVTVLAAPVNKIPVADAGADLTVTLPLDTAVLHGKGTDSDGSISTFQWTKVSGPEGGELATPNADSTKVRKLQQGSYMFRLTVTDNNGATASDEVKIDVNVVTGIGGSPDVSAYSIQVAPNPTTTHFSLKLLSPSPKPAYLRITDAVGRVVAEQKNIQPNTVYTIGHQYRPGVYYAEIIQQGRKATVRLLKLK